MVLLVVTGVLYGIAWRKNETILESKDYKSVVDAGEAKANAYGQEVAKQQAQQYAQSEIERTKDSLMSGGGGGGESGSMGSGLAGGMLSGSDPNYDPYGENEYSGDVAYGGTTEI